MEIKTNLTFLKFRIERSLSPEPKFDSRTLQRYKNDLIIERNDLDRQFALYYEHPGSHPSYKSEWQYFWQKRTNELLRVRIDPNKYDFTEEWRVHFFQYLKEKQAETFYEIKKNLYDKYSNVTKNNYRDSNHGYRRSSHHSSRSSDFYKCRKRSRSSSYSRESRRKRIKVEQQSDHEDNNKTSIRSLVDVCSEILYLDRQVKFNRDEVYELKKRAKNFQFRSNKTYVMSQKDYDFMENLKENFEDYIFERRTSKNVENHVKEICYHIKTLLKHWVKMQTSWNANKLSLARRKLKSLSFQNRNNNFTRNHNNHNSNRKIFMNTKRNNLTITKYDSNETLWGFESDDDAKKDAKSHEICLNSEMFKKTLSNIKEEKTNQELEQLELEKKILQDKIRECSESTSQFSQENKLVIDETADINATFSVSDFTDKELLELFKDFENSSEEEIEILQKIMLELENTDKPRFDRLKAEMEQIQDSIENECFEFVRTIPTSEMEQIIADGIEQISEFQC